MKATGVCGRWFEDRPGQWNPFGPSRWHGSVMCLAPTGLEELGEKAVEIYSRPSRSAFPNLF